jgi:two-component system sensor histidine kinase BaeS
MVVVVALTATVTAISGLVLLRRADEAAARRSLAMLADSVAAQVDAGADAAAAAVGTPAVRVAVVTGTRVTGEPLARLAATPAVVEQIHAGRPVSQRATLQNAVVLVEARPTRNGGVVLAQRRADAGSLIDQIAPQWLWSVAGIGVLAAGVGLVVAWRVVRPLRRLARAATAIGAGDRGPVAVSGPSEVRALASDINQLSADLARSEARQREFLVSVSHDLRTPLTTIAGYAESLADDAIPAVEIPAVGSVLVDETARLARMVSDLLDLARADAGELTFAPVPYDLQQLVTAAATVWEERCLAAGITFTVERPDGPVPVVIDPQRLRQAVDGLLDNAVRITPRGRPVVLACAVAGSTAVLAVRDGGPGLTDDDLAVAFDRGALHERYRGRRQVGTGVGLALVDRLVTRQGGTVSAGHAPEGGAAFTVRLGLAS